MTFESLDHLTLEFTDYGNWYNKLRIHGTLGYVSPVDYIEHFHKSCLN
ncbi:IS3 family transposase [Paenibacillus thiaminolyticus]